MKSLFGEGLLKGLKITFSHLFSKKVTEYYPEEMPKLSPRAHSNFALDADKCISCGLCKNACPNRVINLASVRDENNKRVLTNYEMDIQYCLFCGFCVEVCPTNALKFSQEFETAVYFKEDVKKHMYQIDPSTVKTIAKEESGNV